MQQSLAVVSILFASVGMAEAGLEICNETGQSRSVAIGYKSDGQWVSEGWWNIDPGLCKVTVSGDLKQRYYYYRATAKGQNFAGEDYYFCTQSAAFTIRGDDDCAARGFERAEFRKLDTGKTAKSFTLTLVEDAHPGFDTIPEHSADVMESGLRQGQQGEPFSDLLVFQGCDAIDGVEACAFHGNGWKYYAYADGPTPQSFLDMLFDLPVAAAFQVTGDILSYGDISVEMALASVEYAEDRDSFAWIRGEMQGPWVSMEDPNYKIEIHGSEMREFHGGEFLGNLYLQFTDSCDAAPADPGPVLIQQDPAVREPMCYGIETATQDRLELIYFGRGNMLRFRRP